jgi:hypothetical protein
MPSRRLDDRIRALCAEVVATGEEGRFELAISKLQSALREHNERLRRLALAKLTRLWPSEEEHARLADQRSADQPPAGQRPKDQSSS